MKRYEHAFRYYLPRRSYTLMRLDIRAGHSYLKDAERPFDFPFMASMDLVAIKLCEEIMGAQFAYVQSDEISLLLIDFATHQSEPFFGGNMNKLLSIPPSIASGYMSRLRPEPEPIPQFDCRVWAMSDPVEVANYFVWRQRDAVRNSIQMVGQHYFTQAQLFGQSTDQIQETLFTQHGVNWSHFPTGAKRGRLILKGTEGWCAMGAPTFIAGPPPGLAPLIPPLPSLWDKEVQDVTVQDG